MLFMNEKSQPPGVRYLTVSQAAEQLQMHPETVRDFLRRGILPGKKVGDRQWRISQFTLDQYIEGGEGQGGEEQQESQ